MESVAVFFGFWGSFFIVLVILLGPLVWFVKTMNRIARAAEHAADMLEDMRDEATGVADWKSGSRRR